MLGLEPRRPNHYSGSISSPHLIPLQTTRQSGPYQSSFQVASQISLPPPRGNTKTHHDPPSARWDQLWCPGVEDGVRDARFFTQFRSWRIQKISCQFLGRLVQLAVRLSGHSSASAGHTRHPWQTSVPQYHGGTPANCSCPLTHGDALDAAPRRCKADGVGQEPWHLAVTQGV